MPPTGTADHREGASPTPPERPRGGSPESRRRSGAAALVLSLCLLASACASSGGDRPLRGGKQRGEASWYGPGFDGNRTANGETYDMEALTAAHRTLPFGTWLEVRNLDNGRRTVVRVNDRGPFVRGRIVDLSRAAARELDMLVSGTARVELRVLPGPPPGRERVLVASAPLPAAEGWVVQVGAFRERERADRLARELRAAVPGITVYPGQDGYYRVQLRRIVDRDEAERLRDRLHRAGYEAVISLP